MLIGGIAMGLAVRVWEIPVHLDAAGIAAVAAMAVIGTVVAYTLYLQGVGEIGAAKAGMLASVEPVTATAISVLWLHSDFGPMDALCFVLILATVFLLAKKEEA